MKIYVGRLPYSTTDQELTELFGRFGEVVSANVILDRETGQSRGFGFVEIKDDQAAQNAISELNNSTLSDRTIVVNEANERREPRRDGGRGGFQGRGRSNDSGYRDR